MDNAEGVLRWWWIRHAPTAGPTNLIHGTDDASADLSNSTALTRLANSLPSDAKVLTSALPRAVQTFAALRHLNRNLAAAQIDPDLGEQDFGRWTGRTWDEVDSEAQGFWNDPIDTAPPAGESYRAMCERVQRCIANLTVASHGDLMIVAHAGPIRAALAVALDLPFEASIRFEIAALSLTRIDAIRAQSGMLWRVHAVNLQPGHNGAGV